MTTATTATIDLREPYRREFMVHILSTKLANLAECAGASYDDAPLPPAASDLAVLGIESVLGPFLDYCAPMRVMLKALETLADPDAESLDWPFGFPELVEGMHDCVKDLHASMACTPSGGLTRHAEATIAARDYVALLDDEGGDA